MLCELNRIHSFSFLLSLPSRNIFDQLYSNTKSKVLKDKIIKYLGIKIIFFDISVGYQYLWGFSHRCFEQNRQVPTFMELSILVQICLLLPFTVWPQPNRLCLGLCTLLCTLKVSVFPSCFLKKSCLLHLYLLSWSGLYFPTIQNLE